MLRGSATFHIFQILLNVLTIVFPVLHLRVWLRHGADFGRAEVGLEFSAHKSPLSIKLSDKRPLLASSNQQTGVDIERRKEADLSLSRSPEDIISHYESNAGLGVRGAFVDFGFVLHVDCPGRLDPILVFDRVRISRLSREMRVRRFV